MLRLGLTARRIREHKGLTQKAVAESLEITQVHLSNIENSKVPVSPTILARYRELWGIDLYILAWCLYGDPNELPEPVRGPMRALAKAWKAELGALLPEKQDK